MCSCSPKEIKASKIKTSNSFFHQVCLEFFHLVFIPWVKLCILFCNQLAFNLFGTLSPFLSVHRWVIAAALHPAKRGFSQLRGHYLDSYWTAISTCGLEGGHVHSSQDQTRHWALPWYACSKVMLQTSGDYRWVDSRYQTCDGAAGGCKMKMRWSALNQNIICVLSNWEKMLLLNAPFQTPNLEFKKSYEDQTRAHKIIQRMTC